MTDNRLALTQAAAVAKPTLPGTSDPAPTTPAQPVSQPSTVAPATTTKARPSQSTSPTKVDPSSSDPTGQTSSEGEDTAPLKSPEASSSVANVSPLPDKPQTTAEGDDLAPAKTTAPHDGGNGDSSSPTETEQPNLLPNPSPTVENGQVPSQGGDSGPSSSANLASIILQGLGIIASSAKALPVPGGQSVSQVEASAPTSIAVFRNGNSIVIAGATIAPGQTTEVNGQAVSILSAGSGFVLGGTTIPLEEGQQTDISAMPSPASATQLAISRNGDTIIAGSAEVGSGQATTIDGHVMSNIPGGSSIVLDGSTIAIATGSQTLIPAVVSPGASSLTLSRNGDTIIAGDATIAPGQVATVGDQTISNAVGGGSVVIGGSTINIPAGGQTAILTAASTTSVPLTISRNGDTIIAGGSTLTPGQIATINGQIVSNIPGGSSIFIDGSTIALPAGGQTTIPASPATSPLAISRDGSNIIAGGVTVAPSQVATIGGQIISNIAGGSSLVVDGSTIGLLAGGGTTFVHGEDPSTTILTAGSQTLTAFASAGSVTGIVVDGETITNGGAAATISGETFSLGSSGLVQIDASKTITLATNPAGQGPSSTVFTAGSKIWIAYASDGSVTEAIVDGITMTIGGSALTISGETFSLGSSGLVEIDASTTTTLGDSRTTGASTTTAHSTAKTAGVTASKTGYGQRNAILTSWHWLAVLGLALML